MSTPTRPAAVPITARGTLLRGLVALAAALALTTLIGPAPQAQAAVVVPDPGRNDQTPTAWGWHYNVSPSTASGFIKKGYRIVDLEVRSSSPRFDVSYVRNSGSQARAWWWYYGLTGSQVGDRLRANDGRLLDIEPYETSRGTRYAVVMVRNTGSAAKSWGWHYNVPLSTIVDYTKKAGMRVIDVDRHASGSRFSAVYIKNTGVDAKAWWHYYNVTHEQVKSFVARHQARILNLERLPNGRFDVVLQKNAGEYWWWLVGATAAEVGQAANQFGARIYQVKAYPTSQGTRYHALFLGNVDAETRRVYRAAGRMTGKWGFYLKRVGGPDKLGIGQDNVFEPASMIKIVHAVTAMRDIQNGPATTATQVPWNARPSAPARYPTDADYSDDKNKCAYDGNGNVQNGAAYSDKLGPTIIRQTMVWSDNRTTDALTNRYGFAALNATAAQAGMTKSGLFHRIGCGSAAPPQPRTHNAFTLRDAGRIYERVENATLLDASHRDQLYGYMGGGTLGNGALKDMIVAEANAAGLSASERDQFLARVATRSKGGSYDSCPNWGGNDPCNPDVVSSRTVGGVIWLPVKGRTGAVTDAAYVYGRYFETRLDCTFASVDAGTCADFNANVTGMNAVAVEMFRAEVKQALATW